jgi:hypothetical protein
LRGTGIGRYRCQAIPTVLFDHQRLVQQCAAHPPEGTPWYPARVVHYSTEARRRGVLRSPFTRTSYLADEIWPAGIWACLPGYHHTRVDGRRGKDPSGGGDTQPTDLSLSEEAAWLPNGGRRSEADDGLQAGGNSDDAFFAQGAHGCAYGRLWRIGFAAPGAGAGCKELLNGIAKQTRKRPEGGCITSTTAA